MSAVAALEAFEAERGRLFGLAYRLLGSVGEAEDTLQDAYLRWHGADRAAVDVPRAFLTTVVTRLCLDRLRRLRGERAHYSGPWLPEPLVDPLAHPDVAAPEAQRERDETLSLAMLRMLERLAPHERAVFVLREAMDLEYSEIAGVLGAPAATCRQWFRRAREHLAGERRFELAPSAQWELLPKLQAALAAGDVRALANLLDPGVQMRGDGGGKVSALISVVTDPLRVATVLLHLWRKQGGTAVPVRANGGIGLALLRDGVLDSLTTFEVADGRVLYFDSVRNPDKLRSVAARLPGVGAPADG